MFSATQPYPHAKGAIMPNRSILLTVALAALCLSACDKKRADAPTPQVLSDAALPAKAPGLPGDTSVPAAAAVLTPAEGRANTVPDTMRTNKTMTRAEESAAMPMAGQANDHSAPLAADKRASAP